MSSPGDDPGLPAALQELQSRLSVLPPELKRAILELVVEDDRRLVMKLVSQSSICKQWLEHIIYRYINIRHDYNFLRLSAFLSALADPKRKIISHNLQTLILSGIKMSHLVTALPLCANLTSLLHHVIPKECDPQELYTLFLKHTPHNLSRLCWHDVSRQPVSDFSITIPPITLKNLTHLEFSCMCLPTADCSWQVLAKSAPNLQYFSLFFGYDLNFNDIISVFTFILSNPPPALKALTITIPFSFAHTNKDVESLSLWYDDQVTNCNSRAILCLAGRHPDPDQWKTRHELWRKMMVVEFPSYNFRDWYEELPFEDGGETLWGKADKELRERRRRIMEGKRCWWVDVDEG